MKKIYILIAMFGALVSFSACNDEWTEELYSQMVSFKAPVGSNGVNNVYIRYKANGTGTYALPVIVSGSKMNGKALDVKISVDNDTLAELNKEKYDYRTDLYYKQLPENFYQLPAKKCHIPADSCQALYNLTFNFAGLDMVEKWVLPLTIDKDPSYTLNRRLGWNKALLNINLFNDYSGSYSATVMNVYLGNDNTPTAATTRTARVNDENSIFFYAGVVWEEAEDRGKYKIIVKFDDPTTLEDGTKKGNLEVSAADPDINFSLTGTPYYTIIERMDPKLPYLKYYDVNLYMTYTYYDVTSVPGHPIKYRASGSMTMERALNTLIPDQDQAIQW
jgi:hypothetical protein